MLDKIKLFTDVFAPTAADRVLIMVDQPHDHLQDHSNWQDRRQMATEWLEAFAAFPVERLPLLAYSATGANNGDLPEWGEWEGAPIPLDEAIGRSTLLLAMTEFSATAPLARRVRQQPGLRVASMPGVLRRMEQTALAADYRQIARQTRAWAEQLTLATGATATFPTGDQCYFDLRYRTGYADDGICHADKPFPLINLPSGEAFIVPYEGEREGEPSQTAGTIPMMHEGAKLILIIENNRIVQVEGADPAAQSFSDYIQEEPARANVAELGLGCNEKAIVQGAVIEDEKAGMHWAYGRSEHLGGTVGPDAFSEPSRVIHQDIVYAASSPIAISTLTLHLPDGKDVPIYLNQ